jgi:hypothetical protein
MSLTFFIHLPMKMEPMSSETSAIKTQTPVNYPKRNILLLGGSVQTVKENAEALAVASKRTGQEVNADKTKYMVMS